MMRRQSKGFAMIGALVFGAIPWASGQTGNIRQKSDFRGAFAYVNGPLARGEGHSARRTLFPSRGITTTALTLFWAT